MNSKIQQRDRAMARIWIDFANKQFVPVFYKLLMEQDQTKQEEFNTEVDGKIKVGNRLLFL